MKRAMAMAMAMAMATAMCPTRCRRARPPSPRGTSHRRQWAAAGTRLGPCASAHSLSCQMGRPCLCLSVESTCPAATLAAARCTSTVARSHARASAATTARILARASGVAGSRYGRRSSCEARGTTPQPARQGWRRDRPGWGRDRPGSAEDPATRHPATRHPAGRDPAGRDPARAGPRRPIRFAPLPPTAMHRATECRP